MSDKQDKKDVVETEIFEEMENDLEISDLIPKFNINTDVQDGPDTCIITDQAVLGIFKDTIDEITVQSNQIDGTLNNFLEMATNGGDASSATKEAIVNLYKTKIDAIDKKIKIADLMTRIKLRERDTFPRYLAQNNNVKIEASVGPSSKTRQLDLIKSLNNK